MSRAVVLALFVTSTDIEPLTKTIVRYKNLKNRLYAHVAIRATVNDTEDAKCLLACLFLADK